jgi:hypothetical protein
MFSPRLSSPSRRLKPVSIADGAAKSLLMILLMKNPATIAKLRQLRTRLNWSLASQDCFVSSEI